MVLVWTLVGVPGVYCQAQPRRPQRPQPSPPAVIPGTDGGPDAPYTPPAPATEPEDAKAAQLKQDIERSREQGRLLVMMWMNHPLADSAIWGNPAINAWVERHGMVVDASRWSTSQIGTRLEKPGMFEMFAGERQVANRLPLRPERERATLISPVMMLAALEMGLGEARRRFPDFKAAHDTRLGQEAVSKRWLFEGADGILPAVADAKIGSGIDTVLARLNEARRLAKAEQREAAAAELSWVMERSLSQSTDFVAARLLVAVPELRTLADKSEQARARAVGLAARSLATLLERRTNMHAEQFVEFGVLARSARETYDGLMMIEAQSGAIFGDFVLRFEGDRTVAILCGDRIDEKTDDYQSIVRWLQQQGALLRSKGAPSLDAKERENLLSSRRWLIALDACRAHLLALRAKDDKTAFEAVRVAAEVLGPRIGDVPVKRWAVATALAAGMARAEHLELLGVPGAAVPGDRLLARLRAELGQDVREGETGGAGVPKPGPSQP